MKDDYTYSLAEGKHVGEKKEVYEAFEGTESQNLKQNLPHNLLQRKSQNQQHHSKTSEPSCLVVVQLPAMAQQIPSLPQDKRIHSPLQEPLIHSQPQTPSPALHPSQLNPLRRQNPRQQPYQKPLPRKPASQTPLHPPIPLSDLLSLSRYHTNRGLLRMNYRNHTPLTTWTPATKN